MATGQVTPYKFLKQHLKANSYKLKTALNQLTLKRLYISVHVQTASSNLNQGYDDDRSLQQVVESLCKQGSYRYYLSKTYRNLCCGLSFENYDDVYERVVRRLARCIDESISKW